VIGEIDEPFLEKLERGDTFVLGGKTYRFVSAKGKKAYVDPFEGLPTIPSWIGEMLPLEYDSAIEIGKFRDEIELTKGTLKDEKETVGWLQREYGLERRAAHNVVRYFEEQKKYAGIIPNHRRIVIEQYHADMDRQNIVFHAPVRTKNTGCVVEGVCVCTEPRVYDQCLDNDQRQRVHLEGIAYEGGYGLGSRVNQE
jgi:ATP-dependent Lhr-like helicase